MVQNLFQYCCHDISMLPYKDKIAGDCCFHIWKYMNNIKAQIEKHLLILATRGCYNDYYNSCSFSECRNTGSQWRWSDKWWCYKQLLLSWI